MIALSVAAVLAVFLLYTSIAGGGNPSLAPYPKVSEYSRNKGYAGPANQKAAESSARYVIVNTFAQAIQSGDAASAVQQAEAQLKRIYGG